MKKTYIICFLVTTLVILGLSNPVFAADQTRRPIQLLALDDYNADRYVGIEGDFEDIFMIGAPDGKGVEVDETGSYGYYSMEMQWIFADVPTDGDTYYYKFQVDYLGEWFNVYYWYNSGWVYLGTVTSTGSKTFTIATPQSSSPSFAYVDYLGWPDFGVSSWQIGWSYIRVYS
jgi:hypothetical protein